MQALDLVDLAGCVMSGHRCVEHVQPAPGSNVDRHLERSREKDTRVRTRNIETKMHANLFVRAQFRMNGRVRVGIILVVHSWKQVETEMICEGHVCE